MSNEKGRYYWIKLKKEFFEDEAVDFLLSQKNGSDYIVLYQMLCLETVNNNGELYSQIGEMLIPYNTEKIQRITKYFSFDTIAIALELYKKLGLIYEMENEILRIANFENMVGSESKWAEKKRVQREKQKQLSGGISMSIETKKEEKDNVQGQSKDIEGTMSKDNEGTMSTQKKDNVLAKRGQCPEIEGTMSDKSIEYRDKSIEYRDIENKERVKERKDNLARSYGNYKNVLLTDEDYQEAKELYGETLDAHIEILDEYMEQTGKTYKSCLLAMKKWVHNAYLERLNSSGGAKQGISIPMPQYMIDQANGTLKTNPVTEETLTKAKEMQKRLGESEEETKGDLPI